jgi:hypothetical protein
MSDALSRLLNAAEVVVEMLIPTNYTGQHAESQKALYDLRTAMYKMNIELNNAAIEANKAANKSDEAARDELAKIAFRAMLDHGGTDLPPNIVAGHSYAFADAMLVKARNSK